MRTNHYRRVGERNPLDNVCLSVPVQLVLVRICPVLIDEYWSPVSIFFVFLSRLGKMLLCDNGGVCGFPTLVWELWLLW